MARRRRGHRALALAIVVLTVGAAGCGSTGGSAQSTRSTRRAAPPQAVRPAPLSPRAERALLATITTTRACLTQKGLRVSGGPVYPQQSPTSADGELIVGTSGGGAFIAFYSSASRAAQLEPGVTQNARGVRGRVERRGAVTVLLIRHPAPSLRQAVLTCAFA